MSEVPRWRDATLEAFFQTAARHYERQGGLAALLDETFPVRIGPSSVEVASYDCVAVDGGIEIVIVVRVVLWSQAGEIEDVLEQEVGALALPYQREDGGFEHGGIPLVTDATSIIDRVERYVAGVQEAIIANWHAWLHGDERMPQDLFPAMA